MKHKGSKEEFQEKLTAGWGEWQQMRRARRQRYVESLAKKAAEGDHSAPEQPADGALRGHQS